MATIALIGTLAAAPALGQSFSDSDWTTSFGSNCPLPVASGPDKSIAQIRIGTDRKVAFRLRPGDVGGCSMDATARHRARFWERAELAQNETLALGKRHEISFSVQLPEGFTGKRETFFQIHGLAPGCPAAPLVMLKFHRGRLELNSLRGVEQTLAGTGIKGGHHRFTLRGATLEQFRSREQHLTLTLDLRSDPGTVGLLLDGKPLLAPTPVEYAACARPHIKFGIYRPGRGKGVSRAIFDDFTVLTRD